MEPNDHILCDGKPVKPEQCAGELLGLLGTNYTYRLIHTAGNRPLHLATQIKLLTLSYKALFGGDITLDPETTGQNISELLYRNNASPGGNLVRIAAHPDSASGKATLMGFYEGPLVYPGYTIWHRPMSAMALTYEIPFPVFKTSANRLCHTYAQQYVIGKGYGLPVTLNYRGEAVSAGEDPLFAVAGREMYVADAETSVPQSAERLAGMEICEKAGLAVIEKAVPASSLADMDELFAFTPQGIVSIGTYDNKLYPSAMVRTLDRYLEELKYAEFL